MVNMLLEPLRFEKSKQKINPTDEQLWLRFHKEVNGESRAETSKCLQKQYNQILFHLINSRKKTSIKPALISKITNLVHF